MLKGLDFDPPAAAARAQCIGVLDSGVGGLTVLRALHRRLPGAAMVYIGDVSHAPYGERPADEIAARCVALVGSLAARGARLIVVACNTATVLAIEALRARWPALSFVGVEPGVKPAVFLSRSRRIAVMATTATAASARLRELIDRHAQGAHVHVQPCPGLAAAIERGVLDGPELLAVLRPGCESIIAANVDTVVLGCTHYPFVEPTLRVLLGADITLIDTAAAIAERTASLWEQGSPRFETTPDIRVLSTGALGTMQLLLERCAGLEQVRVARLSEGVQKNSPSPSS